MIRVRIQIPSQAFSPKPLLSWANNSSMTLKAKRSCNSSWVEERKYTNFKVKAWCMLHDIQKNSWMLGRLCIYLSLYNFKNLVWEMIQEFKIKPCTERKTFSWYLISISFNIILLKLWQFWSFQILLAPAACKEGLGVNSLAACVTLKYFGWSVLLDEDKKNHYLFYILYVIYYMSKK